MFWKSICRKIPVLESLWSLQACNLSRNRLWHRCYPGKFAKFLTTTISNNICERLLLDQYSYKRESSSVFTRKSKSTRKFELHKSIHTEFKNNFWTNITLSVVQSKKEQCMCICNLQLFVSENLMYICLFGLANDQRMACWSVCLHI